MKKYIIAMLILILLAFPVSATNTHTAVLNGSNQYWSITDASQTGLGITGDLTMEFWVKTTATGDRYYINFFDNGTGDGYGMVTGAGASNGKVKVLSGGSWSGQNDTAFNDGNWHHVAAVISGSNVYFYYDGQPDGSTSAAVPDAFTGTRTIGANNAGSFGFVSGDMDEVRIWNVARTAQQIEDNYNCSLAGTETNLVAYWRFDNDGNDSTSNDNDLTNNNSITFQSASLPFTNSCGGATYVDGFKSYINIIE